VPPDAWPPHPGTCCTRSRWQRHRPIGEQELLHDTNRSEDVPSCDHDSGDDQRLSDAQRCGVVACPKCGVTRAVNLVHYKGELGGKLLKVKCAACATVVNVRFDFRYHHRVAVRLPGTLVQCETKHVLASLTVTSLSVSGVGFTLRTPLPV
jgi:hypothetical protein